MADEKTPPRTGDRRKVNAKVLYDRRGTGHDKRDTCPKCGSPVGRDVRKTKTGTITSTYCTRCHYAESSVQTDVEVLLAKLTWELPLEQKGPMYHIPIPHELVETLGMQTGDTLVLKPATSTIGSMDMRWLLEVKKVGKRRAV